MKLRTKIRLPAQQIRPYEPPQYLVQTAAEPGIIAVDEIEVLETGILGWGAYNAIIRVGGVDYLALLPAYLL